MEILALTLKELEEYTQHDLVTRVFGKIDPNSISFLTLKEQILADGKIFEPAIAYEGKQLIAGNKRQLIALTNADQHFKDNDWRFYVRVFNGSQEDALNLVVSTNTAHAIMSKTELAIAGAKLWDIRKELFRKETSFSKIGSQLGISADLVEDAHTILSSGNEKCIRAITDKKKPQSINSIADMIKTFSKKPEVWDNLVYNKDLRKHAIADAKKVVKKTDQQVKFNNGVVAANRGDLSEKNEDRALVYGAVYTSFDSGIELPVGDTAAVFMWARPSQLFNAVSSLEAKGFTGNIYNFIRTFGKPINYHVEHLIVATKGNPPLPDFTQNLLLNLKEGLPKQYGEAIAATYQIPILSTLKTNHGEGKWEYDPPLAEKPKPKPRAATGTGKGKTKKNKEEDQQPAADTND